MSVFKYSISPSFSFLVFLQWSAIQKKLREFSCVNFIFNGSDLRNIIKCHQVHFRNFKQANLNQTNRQSFNLKSGSSKIMPESLYSYYLQSLQRFSTRVCKYFRPESLQGLSECKSALWRVEYFRFEGGMLSSISSDIE